MHYTNVGLWQKVKSGLTMLLWCRESHMMVCLPATISLSPQLNISQMLTNIQHIDLEGWQKVKMTPCFIECH